MCINCLQSERNTLIVSVFKRERSLPPDDRKQLRTAYRQGGEGLDGMHMREELCSAAQPSQIQLGAIGHCCSDWCCGDHGAAVVTVLQWVQQITWGFLASQPGQTGERPCLHK